MIFLRLMIEEKFLLSVKIHNYSSIFSSYIDYISNTNIILLFLTRQWHFVFQLSVPPVVIRVKKTFQPKQTSVNFYFFAEIANTLH